MKILGIDQSFTSTGIVLADFNKLTKSLKVLEFTCFTSDDHINHYKRAQQVAAYCTHWAVKNKPDIVAVEGVAFCARGDMTRALAGLQFSVINALNAEGYEVQVIAPTSVKKTAGNGKASKMQMFNALPDDFQIAIQNSAHSAISKGRHDICDAYWIALTAGLMQV
jgi:Holliday junction resolvasome RuvABC endonuclease subunit